MIRQRNTTVGAKGFALYVGLLLWILSHLFEVGQAMNHITP